MMAEQHALFELLDQIVCLDLGARGIGGLYAPARALGDGPISLQAAMRLSALQPGDVVAIVTGSLSRASVAPHIAENDGPMGAAVLARALSVGFNAIPVLLADEPIIDKVAGVARIAGCNIVNLEQARMAASLPRFTQVATTATAPVGDAAARDDAPRLLQSLAPKAVIAIERAGLTADGTYRNALGQDYSEGRARLDYLVQAARDAGVSTIGIGDGGNEIGMGAVREAVHAHVPHGPVLCAQLATDVLLPAGVSNWGAYAVVAALAILTGRPELAHSRERERRLLHGCSQLGLIDGSTGRLDPTADGMPIDVHLGIVDLLEQVVRSAAKQA
ncbi:MAG: hypothetical protein ACI8PT_003440 [Gammaproteobacteria bacterium]|jgi:hypothetical protein